MMSYLRPAILASLLLIPATAQADILQSGFTLNDKYKCRTIKTTITELYNMECAAAISNLVGTGLFNDETPECSLADNEQFSLTFTIIDKNGEKECFSSTLFKNNIIIGRADNQAKCEDLMRACNLTYDDLKKDPSIIFGK